MPNKYYWTIIKPSNEQFARVVRSSYAAAVDPYNPPNLKPWYFTSRKQAEAIKDRLNKGTEQE